MMTPIFLNPPTSNASSFPFMEFQEKQCDRHSSQHNNLSSSSSLSSTLFTKSPPPDDQFARRNPSSDDPSNHNDHNKVYDEYTTHGESSDHNSHHQVDSASGHLYYNKVSSAKQQDGVGENVRNGNGSSMKWMCSKVRLMRKMTQSDEKAPSWRIELKTHHDHYQQPENSETVVVEDNNGGDIIRVCSNCNTTKTPLWRSGPQGPKSLCNACGIRQRKARRAMEAAAAGCSTVVTGGGEGSSSSTSVKSTLKLVTKKKKSRSSHYNLAEHNKKSAHHHKQRFDQVKESFVDENNEKNHWFEEFAKNLLMKNSSFQRMFTRDEEEGAVLLMALSYGHGLVQS